MPRTFKIKYSLKLLLHAVSQRLLYSKGNLRIKHENERVFETCAVDVVQVLFVFLDFAPIMTCLVRKVGVVCLELFGLTIIRGIFDDAWTYEFQMSHILV